MNRVQALSIWTVALLDMTRWCFIVAWRAGLFLAIAMSVSAYRRLTSQIDPIDWFGELIYFACVWLILYLAVSVAVALILMHEFRRFYKISSTISDLIRANRAAQKGAAEFFRFPKKK